MGILTLAVLGSCPVLGEILFEESVWEGEAAYGSPKVEFRFPFKNTGKEAIEIRHIQSSCGCTVPQLQKKVYQPGEAGEITGSFDLKGRKGEQVSTLHVTTNQSTKGYELRVKVKVPELLQIRPGLLVWRSSAEPQSQVVTLRPNTALQVRITEVVSDVPEFETNLTSTDEGDYRLEVTPKQLRKNRRGSLRIKTLRGESDTVDWHTIYLRVL